MVKAIIHKDGVQIGLHNDLERVVLPVSTSFAIAAGVSGHWRLRSNDVWLWSHGLRYAGLMTRHNKFSSR